MRVVAVLGVLSIVVGALALLMAGRESHYLVFGFVLSIAGALLVWVGAARVRVGWIGWLAITALGVAGIFVSLLIERETVCCMYGYHRGLGYPWTWVDSFGVTDSTAVVDGWKANPDSLEKYVDDWFEIVLDGLFWWHVAVLVVVPITQVEKPLWAPARPSGK